MHGYYSEKLAAEKLRQVYEIAPARIRQYLDAEIQFVLDTIDPSGCVLELGCGYGRVLTRMAQKAGFTVGIDTSPGSLRLARHLIQHESQPRLYLCLMDAASLGFGSGSFDFVVCIQNGISAFHSDQRTLMAEAVRVVMPGGTALFSSYSEKFWTERLDWFQLQAAHGLLGEIDYEATSDGVIVCKDGFRATTVSADRFLELATGLDADATITEIDGSSLFCTLQKT